jgi:hypothetical protein
MIALIVDGTALAAVALLSISVTVKARALLTRRAQSEAIFSSNLLSPAFAGPLLFFLASIECVTIILLLSHEALGLAVSAGVVFSYGLVLLRLPEDQGCGCFGELLSTSNRIAVWRNAALVLLFSVTGVLASHRGVATLVVTQASAGVALFAVAVLFVLSHVLSNIDLSRQPSSVRRYSV